MTKNKNLSEYVSVAFAIISSLIFAVTLAFTVILWTNNYTLFGNGIIFVATDKMENEIPKNHFISYKVENENFEVGQIVVFDYNDEVYIQEIFEINDNNLTLKDNSQTVVASKNKVMGIYSKTLYLLTFLCNISKIMICVIIGLVIIALIIYIILINKKKKRKPILKDKKTWHARAMLKKGNFTFK